MLNKSALLKKCLVLILAAWCQEKALLDKQQT